MKMHNEMYSRHDLRVKGETANGQVSTILESAVTDQTLNPSLRGRRGERRQGLGESGQSWRCHMHDVPARAKKQDGV